jgi:hypothetical protein
MTMRDKDAQAAEQLERTLGRLTVTFGHLEAELRLLLDCLLGGDGMEPANDAPSVIISSELPFAGLLRMCGKLVETTGFEAEALAEFKRLSAVAWDAEKQRNEMTHASWVPESEERYLVLKPDTGELQRERVPRRKGRRERTVMDIEEVEQAIERCDVARDFLELFGSNYFQNWG